MEKTDLNNQQETTGKNECPEVEGTSNLQENQSNTAENTAETDKLSDAATEMSDIDVLNAKYEALNDSHLRLMAEFDNYRKRTLREKSELVKNGGEKVLTQLLPVIDDFERALQNMHASEDMKAIMEGIDLIYNKFISYLSQQDVKPIETVGIPFNDETSEAVALIPASDPEMKGKVLDCVQTGYVLGDKVIRHAKVVVGE